MPGNTFVFGHFHNFKVFLIFLDIHPFIKDNWVKKMKRGGKMKGIVLAAGSGTRLYPSTIAISKQLLPVYDKPMVYYPISVLMLAGIKDILIISTPHDIENFKKLLGDGSNFGVKFTYKIQPSPDGIAQALTIGEDFIKDEPCALILGDNIFYGPGFTGALKEAADNAKKGYATIFAHQVKNPERFGIVEFDEKKCVKSIVEKPSSPKTNYAATGLYFYDKNASKYAKTLVPSKRGELEITDLNNIYLKNNNLKAEVLGRGFTWLDTGLPKALLDAGEYIRAIEENQGIKIACLEEVALRMGFLSLEDLKNNEKHFPNNDYYNYVRDIIRIYPD